MIGGRTGTKTMNKYDEEQLDWLTMFWGMMQDGCTKEEAITYLVTMDAGSGVVEMCLQHLEDEDAVRRRRHLFGF